MAPTLTQALFELAPGDGGRRDHVRATTIDGGLLVTYLGDSIPGTESGRTLRAVPVDARGCNGSVGTLVSVNGDPVAAQPDTYAIAPYRDGALLAYRVDQNDDDLDFAAWPDGLSNAPLSTWNDPKLTWPALASNGSGTLAAWVHGTGYGSDPGDAIHAGFVDAAGQVTSMFTLAAADGGCGYAPDGGVVHDGCQFSTPEVASFADGTFLVVWDHALDDGARAIEGARVARDGGRLDAMPMLFHRTGPGEEHENMFPSVASDGTQGLVVWAQYNSSPGYRVGGNVLQPDGGIQFDGGTILGGVGERGITPIVHFDGTRFLVAFDAPDDSNKLHLGSVALGGSALTLVAQAVVDVNLDDGTILPSIDMATLPGVGTLVVFDSTLHGSSSDGGPVGAGYVWLPATSDGGAVCPGGSASTTGSSGSAGSSSSTTSSSGATGGSSGSSAGSSSTGSTGTTASTSSTTGGASSASTASVSSTGTTGTSPTRDLYGCSSGGAALAPLAFLALLGLARKRKNLGVMAALVGVGLVAVPARADKPLVHHGHATIAVLSIQAKLGVDPALADLLTTRLVAQIQAVTGHSVISSEDVKNALGLERTKQLLGCSDDSCMAELGGALGVDFMVTGVIAKVGRARTFDVQLMNTARAVVLHRYSHRLPDDVDDSAFLDEVAPAVGALFPVAEGAKPSVAAEVREPGSPRARRLCVDLLGASELNARGGFARLRVGYRVIPAVAVVVGGEVTPSAKPGATAGVELQPINTHGAVRPLLGVGGQVLFNGGTSVGPVASLGVEWEPVPGFTVRAEVPASYMTGAGATHWYVFGGLGVGLRL